MQRTVGEGVEPPGITSGGVEGVLGKPPPAGVALEWASVGLMVVPKHHHIYDHVDLESCSLDIL